MVKILVTGGSGFVGQRLVQAIHRKWPEVYTLDVDIKNGADMRDFCLENNDRWDLVIHCAAVIPDRDTRELHPLCIAENLELDAIMVNWALRTGSRLVYFSSCAAYPLAITDRAMDEPDIDLDSAQTPDGLYGWEKLTGEVLIRAARVDGLDAVVLRPFSGYGTTQSNNYPFRAMIERAQRHEDPFVVWGDGTQVRDFVHVDDIVQTVLYAVEYDWHGPINIGMGRPTTMLGLARLVTAEAGYTPEIVPLSNKASGSPWRVADVKLSHQLYVPEVTLEEGIRRAFSSK